VKKKGLLNEESTINKNFLSFLEEVECEVNEDKEVVAFNEDNMDAIVAIESALKKVTDPKTLPFILARALDGIDPKLAFTIGQLGEKEVTDPDRGRPPEDKEGLVDKAVSGAKRIGGKLRSALGVEEDEETSLGDDDTLNENRGSEIGREHLDMLNEIGSALAAQAQSDVEPQEIPSSIAKGYADAIYHIEEGVKDELGQDGPHIAKLAMREFTTVTLKESVTGMGSTGAELPED
jgi:hypothetical protein